MKSAAPRTPPAEAVSSWLLGRPWLVVSVVAAITVALGLQIPRVRINNELEIFVPEDDPARVANQRVEDVFGSENIMLIGAFVREGTIFDPGVIAAVAELTRSLEGLQYVDSVTSLTNADYIEGTPEGMVVRPLLGDFDGSGAQAETLRERLASWPEIYDRNLRSEDERATLIVVTLVREAGNAEREAVLQQVQALLARHRSPKLDFEVAGIAVVTLEIKRGVERDLGRLVPFVGAVVVVFLFLVFRTASGVLLPMTVVAVSAVWTVGVMPLVGVEFTIVSTAIPVAMIAVASAYGIHLLDRYYAELPEGTTRPGIEECRAAVGRALRAVGKPVWLAGLTTVVGFGSVAASRILPMRHFGLVIAFGVLAAVLLALTLIPALLVMLRPAARRKPRGTSPPAAPWLERSLARLGAFLEARAVVVLAVAAAVSAVSVWALSRIVVENSMIEYFSTASDLRRADRRLNEAFGGTRTLSVVIRGGQPGAMTHPRALKAMETLASALQERHPSVGKILSFAEFVKRMNRTMHADQPDGSAAFDEIPSDPGKYGVADERELADLVSQYLLLYSGSLEGLIDDAVEPKEARLVVQVRAAGTQEARRIAEDAAALARELLPPGYTVQVSGLPLIEDSLTRLVVQAQGASVATALGAVFVIVAFSFRSLIAGLLGCVPLALAILANFGLMGLAGIRLNVATAMIASLAVGVGVDYAIHFLAAWVRTARGGVGSAPRALADAGRAISANALAVAAGFGVLLFSQFIPLQHLGLLVALTMIVSAATALTVLAALLAIGRPAFVRRGGG